MWRLGEYAQLITTLRPSRLLNFSFMVMRSARPWHGWYLSSSMLITGTSAASANGADVLVATPVVPAGRVAVDADGDRLAKARQSLGDVGEALGLVGLLRVDRGRCVDSVRVEIVGVAAELHDPALEAVTGPERPVVEDEEDALVDEQVVLDAACPFELQLKGRVENRVELLPVELHQGNEVPAFQELGNHRLSPLCHGPFGA